MTKQEFKSWLTTHYARGAETINRLAFVADFNDAAESLGSSERISDARLNHWLSGRPIPEEIAGRSFEQFLELVAVRRGNPEAPARIYRLDFPADAETAEALEEIAAGGTGRVEDFLYTTLLAQVEEEIEIHRAAQVKRRKRK